MGPYRKSRLDRFAGSSSRKHRLFVTVCCLIGLTGCSSLPGRKLNAFGAQELVDRHFEEIDLAALLAPGTTPLPGVDAAFWSFHTDTNQGTPERRNAIQERILAASEQRCGRYKIFLKQFEGETNFLFGAITTALAGAGALVSPVAAARALAGSAGVTSGVNAEFNDKLFSKLTVQVLTKAIDSRRKAIYEDILNNRLAKDKDGKPTGVAADLTAYPVEAAVKDALNYHAACSLIAGLEEAGAAIERKENVGIKQLQDVAKQLNLDLKFSMTPKTAPSQQ